jgi:CHAT domain-containing protein
MCVTLKPLLAIVGIRLRSVAKRSRKLALLPPHFIYAGARALLVSHWAVDSNAAMRLTTSTFDIMKSDHSLGQAEALRRAMLALYRQELFPRRRSR